jgi:hypothetical protein
MIWSAKNLSSETEVSAKGVCQPEQPTDLAHHELNKQVPAKQMGKGVLGFSARLQAVFTMTRDSLRKVSVRRTPPDK